MNNIKSVKKKKHSFHWGRSFCHEESSLSRNLRINRGKRNVPGYTTVAKGTSLVMVKTHRNVLMFQQHMQNQ
ncbi:MAG: hypothetical protein ACI4TA_01750, partial [Acetatifactor sp.]